MFAGKKSAQIREILISESAWEEMTCLFAPSLGLAGCDDAKNKETNMPSAAKSDAPKAGGSLIIGITSGDPLAVNPLYASDRTT